MSKIAETYNKQFSSDDKLKKKPFHFNLGVFLGVSSNHIKLTGARPNTFYETRGKLSKSYFVPFGINFHAFTNRKVSVELEAYFNVAEGNRTYSYSSSSTTYIDSVFIKEKSISIPIYLRHNIVSNKSSVFYMKFGAKYVIEPHLEGFLRKEVGDIPIFDLSKRSGVGFNFAVGTEKNISNKTNAKLEYRYCGNSLIHGVNRMEQNISNQIVLGLNLKNKK